MNAIVIERKRKAFTQKRLAHEAGVDVRTLRKMEKGGEVSLETKHLVYKVLGISPEDGAVNGNIPEGFQYTTRHLVANLAALALCVILIVFGLHELGPADPNTVITTTISAPCNESLAEATSFELAATLNGTATGTKTVQGTKTCEIQSYIRTKLPEDATISRIAAAGIDAKILWKERTRSWLPQDPDSIWK